MEPYGDIAGEISNRTVTTDTLFRRYGTVWAPMGDTTKIGARVDQDVWENFKDFVRRRHGRTRGVTADEVEKALRDRMNGQYPSDRIARIENDVATIKANIAEADGGDVSTPPTPSGTASHTHTEKRNRTVPTGSTSDKPDPKAPKSDKVDWFYDHKLPERPIVAPASAFRAWINDAWDFGERAGDDLLRRVFSRYHAKAVKRDRGDEWDVVVADTVADREAKIDAYADDDGSVWVLEDDDGHVEGAAVADTLR